MHTSTRIKALMLIGLAAAGLSAGGAEACSTPVFRYALERWPSDYFPAVVFHRGELSAESKRVLEVFRTAGEENGANVGVYPVDLDKALDKGTAELWQRHKSMPLPCLAVTYSLPYSGRGRRRYADDPFPPTVWAGELTEANARALIDSPVRKEIARRILGGDSAVWVILEPEPTGLDQAVRPVAKRIAYSPIALVLAGVLMAVGIGGYVLLGGGRSTSSYPRLAMIALMGAAVLTALTALSLEDARAEAVEKLAAETKPADSGPVDLKTAEGIATKTLAEAEKIFARDAPAEPGPPSLPVPPGYGPPVAPANLKVAFSTVRISRGDPAERMFVAMLLHSEKDLLSEEFAGEPMVFPVFGRGRLLWVLVGKGINRDNILESCDYITGACSCEVKFQNPGLDLLVSKDWDKALFETMVEDDPEPDLRGIPENRGDDVAASTQPAPDTTGGGPSSAALPASHATGVVFTAVAITLGTLAVGGVALLVALKRRANVR